MRDFMLSLVDFNQTVNFELISSVVGIYLLIFWLAVALWVWQDARQRYDSWYIAILNAILVFVLFIPGLLIYLVIRPSKTAEEEYWEDLERKYLMLEVDGVDECPVCSFPLKPSFMACPKCGKQLRDACKECGALLQKEWLICPFCGEDTGRVEKEKEKLEKIEERLDEEEVDEGREKVREFRERHEKIGDKAVRTGRIDLLNKLFSVTKGVGDNFVSGIDRIKTLVGSQFSKRKASPEKTTKEEREKAKGEDAEKKQSKQDEKQEKVEKKGIKGEIDLEEKKKQQQKKKRRKKKKRAKKRK